MGIYNKIYPSAIFFFCSPQEYFLEESSGYVGKSSLHIIVLCHFPNPQNFMNTHKAHFPFLPVILSDREVKVRITASVREEYLWKWKTERASSTVQENIGFLSSLAHTLLENSIMVYM